MLTAQYRHTLLFFCLISFSDEKLAHVSTSCCHRNLDSMLLFYTLMSVLELIRTEKRSCIKHRQIYFCNVYDVVVLAQKPQSKQVQRLACSVPESKDTQSWYEYVIFIFGTQQFSTHSNSIENGKWSTAVKHPLLFTLINHCGVCVPQQLFTCSPHSRTALICIFNGC